MQGWWGARLSPDTDGRRALACAAGVQIQALHYRWPLMCPWEVWEGGAPNLLRSPLDSLVSLPFFCPPAHCSSHVRVSFPSLSPMNSANPTVSFYRFERWKYFVSYFQHVFKINAPQDIEDNSQTRAMGFSLIYLKEIKDVSCHPYLMRIEFPQMGSCVKFPSFHLCSSWTCVRAYHNNPFTTLIVYIYALTLPWWPE